MTLLETNIAENTQPVAKGLSIECPPSTWLDRLQDRWAARRRRARDVSELAALSDRELLDLGLGRYDLRAISKGTYRCD